MQSSVLDRSDNGLIEKLKGGVQGVNELSIVSFFMKGSELVSSMSALQLPSDVHGGLYGLVGHGKCLGSNGKSYKSFSSQGDADTFSVSACGQHCALLGIDDVGFELTLASKNACSCLVSMTSPNEFGDERKLSSAVSHPHRDLCATISLVVCSLIIP